MDQYYIKRERQTNELRQILSRSRMGASPRLILVKGSAGIGKTTFLKNFELTYRPELPVHWLTNAARGNIEKRLEDLFVEIRREGASREFAAFVDDAEQYNSREIDFIYHRIANYKYCTAIAFAAREPYLLDKSIRDRKYEIIHLDHFNQEESVSFLEKYLDGVEYKASDLELPQFGRHF